MMCIVQHITSFEKREVDITRGLSFHHLLFLFILVVFAENRKSELSIRRREGGHK